MMVLQKSRGPSGETFRGERDLSAVWKICRTVSHSPKDTTRDIEGLEEIGCYFRFLLPMNLRVKTVEWTGIDRRRRIVVQVVVSWQG